MLMLIWVDEDFQEGGFSLKLLRDCEEEEERCTVETQTVCSHAVNSYPSIQQI